MATDGRKNAMSKVETPKERLRHNLITGSGMLKRGAVISLDQVPEHLRTEEMREKTNTAQETASKPNSREISRSESILTMGFLPNDFCAFKIGWQICNLNCLA
jgi:hypothetical protein